MHRDEVERQEIVQELPGLLAAVQQMGQALTNKSHGVDYHRASEFNELLHLARLKLDEIQIETEVRGGKFGCRQQPRSMIPATVL
jgi:hypothetical protein